MPGAKISDPTFSLSGEKPLAPNLTSTTPYPTKDGDFRLHLTEIHRFETFFIQTIHTCIQLHKGRHLRSHQRFFGDSGYPPAVVEQVAVNGSLWVNSLRRISEFQWLVKFRGQVLFLGFLK